MSINADDILGKSDLLYSADAVKQAVDQWAVRVQLKIAESDLPCIALVVMKGGLIPAAWLLQRLSATLQIDYVHATRYMGNVTGKTLQWVYQPEMILNDRQVLLIDDIFDYGYTMQAVADWCQAQGAERVVTAALVKKLQPHGLSRDWLDCGALTVPDKYVFGCGMDIHEHWRHLPAIYTYSE